MNLSTTFAKIRKTVAGVSLAALMLSMFATGAVASAKTTTITGQIWNDVPADAWFYTYVNDLTTKSVVDSPNTANKSNYRPGDLVNRAELAKLIVTAAGIPVKTATSAPFKDVPMGQWYTNYIYTLSSEGIVSGDMLNGQPTGTFRPDGNVNRAEAAKFLVNGFMFANNTTGGPHFPDVSSSAWYYNYVETAYNNTLVAGYPDGKYRPANNINRAEIAKMVDQAMGGVVHGFTLSDAGAASATSVVLTFSQNVDTATANVAANYAITDASGTAVTVSAAAVQTDPTQVLLTTGTQTAGTTYNVTATNIKSEAGDDLANTDSVSFLGYGADVSGGALKVALSSQTPVQGSIPEGANGVVFTCWDFTAGSNAAIVKSLNVHRVGPGAPSAFDNVYLYRGDSRLTSGRTISTDTNMVNFNNINQSIAASENAKFCLVGDLSTTSSGGVHAFEIASASDVMSNSSNMTGSFPLRGSDQLITSATVGTTTVTANGSLNQLTIGQQAGRIAQFQLEANGVEDQNLQRLALYVRGSVAVSDVRNLKLYAYGDSTPLATVATVGAKDLATFTLATPYKIGRGDRKIFYVTADLSPGRDQDTIKTYLDEASDLLVTGATYGYGTGVTDTNYDGSTPNNYSLVTVKGSTFNVAFTGTPAAQDIATGQQGVSCLNLNITNASGSDVDLKDWRLNMAVAIGNSANNDEAGLWNSTTKTANYTLIKLAKLNADGSIGGTILGSTELASTTDTGSGADINTTNYPLPLSPDLKLGGTYTVPANTSIKAAIVFNTANNASMATDQVTCTLDNLTTTPNVDAVKDINGDALTAGSITPASDITGNPLTITTSSLTVAVTNSPSSQTVVKGTNNQDLLGISLQSGSSLDNTLKSLTVQGYISKAGLTPFATPTSGTPPLALALKDVVNTLGLYDGTTQVGTSANVDSTTGKIVFDNLSVSIPKNSTKVLTLKGNLSNNTPNSTRVKFGIVAPGDLTSIDQNGQSVSGIVVTNASNGGAADSGVRITIASQGTVKTSSIAQNNNTSNLIGGGVSDKKVAVFQFNMTNAPATLQDFDLSILGDSSAISNVKLYQADCSTPLGATTGYTVTSGMVNITGANIALPLNNTQICVKADFNPVVISGTPLSGATASVALSSVSKIISGGTNISSDFDSQTLAIGATVMTAATTSLILASGSVNVGDILRVDNELMYVSAFTSLTATVTRGFAGTTATAHAIGATVHDLTAQFSLKTLVSSTDTTLTLASGSVNVGDTLVINNGTNTDTVTVTIFNSSSKLVTFTPSLVNGYAVGTVVQDLTAGALYTVYDKVTSPTTTPLNRGSIISNYNASTPPINTYQMCIDSTCGSNSISINGAAVAPSDTVIFNQAGVANRLRTIVPTVAVSSSLVSGTLNGGTQIPIAAFDITANGSANSTMQFKSTDELDITLTQTLADVTTCTLYNGSQAVSGAKTVLSGPIAQNLTFPFTANAISLSGGHTITLTLKCNTGTLAALDSVSTSLTDFSYNDGSVDVSLTKDTNMIYNRLPLAGQNFTAHA